MHGARRTAGAWAWDAAAALALVALARWLDTPGVEYAVAAAVASVAAAVLLVRVARGRQGPFAWTWQAATTALLLSATAVAGGTMARLIHIERDWPAWRDQRGAAALAQLDARLTATVRDLHDRAERALDAPADRDAAFAAMAGIAGKTGEERGVVLYRDDAAAAWAGRIRVPAESMLQPAGIVARGFYLYVYATAARGRERAVAMALVQARAPGDRLTDGIADAVAAAADVAGFRLSIGVPGAPPAAVGERRIPVGDVVLNARVATMGSGEAAVRERERAGVRVGLVLVLALGCFVFAVWRRARGVRARLAALAVALACVALVPLNELSNVSRLFDPSVYFTPLGGPLTANAGALALTGIVALLAVLTLFRRHGRRMPRHYSALLVLLVAGVGPFLLRDLARGIQSPAYGTSPALWLMWEIPLFLAGVSVLLVGAGTGAAALGGKRGLPAWSGPVVAAVAAVVASLVWQAPGRWPWWYTGLWIIAVAALAFSRPTRHLALAAATVGALGAMTLVWGRTARERVMLAEHDLASLGSPDAYAQELLTRLASRLRESEPPRSRDDLLQIYEASDLAPAGYPTEVEWWRSAADTAPYTEFTTARFDVPHENVRSVVAAALKGDTTVVTPVSADPAMALLAAVPMADGSLVTVMTAPRTQLIAPDPFAQLIGLADPPSEEADPPYTLQLGEQVPDDVPVGGTWKREGDVLHGDWIVRTGTGEARAHTDVELRPVDALIERGTLVLLLDLAIVALLWLAAAVADGGVGRWLRARQRMWGRSYRARLTIALFGFFAVPAVTFGAWSYRRLATDALQSRELLVRETLRAVAPSDSSPGWVAREGRRLETPLLYYAGGELQQASDSLLIELAPLGRYLRPDVLTGLVLRDEISASRRESIGDSPVLVGYRAVGAAAGEPAVIAAPARPDEQAVQRRGRDLGVLVLFAIAVGAAAALWLSGVAARQLARPIGSLRSAALSLAEGERLPRLDGEPTTEFVPVFSAFTRMAADLDASRSALEEAQRRTAAVLRNVASGVVAVDEQGRVTLANPRAQAMLGAALEPGSAIAPQLPAALTAPVLEFLHDLDRTDEAFDLSSGERQLQARVTRLARGGAVVTVDDVTELASAQRVLAWGEMARQVAHEIKNPLTPIRLGVQHLRRARADKRVDFDKVLDQNVTRILTEIDRLDEIARSFSRYGSAPEERAPAVPTDVAAIARDVIALERMGHESSALHWNSDGLEAPAMALARGDELREVLLNVYENARLANATEIVTHIEREAETVTIEVRDNGHGIPASNISRVFEPHFSTRTSGSGLGLAISRRLIDGWGGSITLDSEEGRGTAVFIQLRNG